MPPEVIQRTTYSEKSLASTCVFLHRVVRCPTFFLWLESENDIKLKDNRVSFSPRLGENDLLSNTEAPVKYESKLRGKRFISTHKRDTVLFKLIATKFELVSIIKYKEKWRTAKVTATCPWRLFKNSLYFYEYVLNVLP